jgi:putative membrane protein insertion efficiency factor
VGSGPRSGPGGAARLLIWLVRLYQLLVSPLMPPACRYYPSCSAYAVTVVARDGFWRGGHLALKRVLRCRPFMPGGLDLP